MILAWAAVMVFVVAAGRDLGWRVIDHRLVASLVLLWLGHVVLAGWDWASILAHAGIGAAAFLVTLVFYSFGWMGGGDVKLAVPVFLWAGPDHGLAIVVLVTVAGAALAVLGVVARACIRMPLPVWGRRGLGLISTEQGVPYGVALAFGGAVAALSASAGMG